MFPGIRTVFNVAMVALDTNRWPSEVYSQFKKMPRDIELILAAMDYRRKLEEKEKTELDEKQAKLLKDRGLSR